MKLTIMIFSLMLLASGAAAQTCPATPTPGKDLTPEALSLGIAVAAVPPTEAGQQEKAPPDSVLVDVQPALKKRTNPVYPKLALAAGIEGTVYVRLWVDKEGKVRDVRILKSDQEVLNQSAVDAARQYEFEPASVGGKPVSTWVVVPFKFKIADKAEGATSKGLHTSLQGAIDCIMTILTEKETAKCKSAVAPDAYAVVGNHYLPLADAIERRGTPKGLPDEQGWELGLVHTITDDGTKVATLLLRTVQKKTGAFRFHTVVCARSGDAGWKIRHWHAGQ